VCRIAGWNWHAYPLLQTSFHIGDQLISINDMPVTSARAARSMLKSCADRTAAQLVLRRLPVGYVCLLKRDDHQFESLGLRTLSGTAEVSGWILHTLKNLFIVLIVVVVCCALAPLEA